MVVQQFTTNHTPISSEVKNFLKFFWKRSGIEKSYTKLEGIALQTNVNILYKHSTKKCGTTPKNDRKQMDIKKGLPLQVIKKTSPYPRLVKSFVFPFSLVPTA